MLQQKSLNLLKLLMGHTNTTVEELESQTSLSTRQIEYNLENINLWLFNHGYNKILKGTNGSLYFNNDVNIILDELSKENLSYVLNEKERQTVIYLYIYLNYDFISLYHLIDLLEVSRGTIQKDINSLKEKLSDYDLEILYSRKDGYYIEGNERKIDYYMMKMIVKMITHNDLNNVLKVVLNSEKINFIEHFKSKLIETIHQQNKYVSENNADIISYIFNLYNIRKMNNETNNYIEAINDLKYDFNEFEELYIAKDILDNYEGAYPKQKFFLTSLLLSYLSGDSNENSKDYCTIQNIIINILKTLKRSYAVSLNNQDHVFDQLYAHIKPAIYRILFEYPMENPLKKQIIEQYRSIYIIIKEIFEESIKSTGSKATDDELSYLTIHFATFLTDDMPVESKKYYAVIVCPSGVGVSTLLHQELSKLFPNVTFLESRSINELDDVINDVDIVFSTNVIETNKPLLLVSPVMNNVEKFSLVENFNKKVNQIKSRDTLTIKTLVKIVEKYANIIDKEGLIYEISNLLSSNKIVHEKRRQPTLSELMTENLIQLNIEADDWRDAIIKSAQPLVDSNKVTNDYVQAMIQNTEENGPYIVISKNVALPHARPEQGALQAAIGITTLKKPVKFGSKNNDPVKYVFCLSAVDNITHLRGLSELVDLLEDQDFYERLDSAQEPDEIITFLDERREKNG